MNVAQQSVLDLLVPSNSIVKLCEYEQIRDYIGDRVTVYFQYNDGTLESLHEWIITCEYGMFRLEAIDQPYVINILPDSDFNKMYMDQPLYIQRVVDSSGSQ